MADTILCKPASTLTLACSVVDDLTPANNPITAETVVLSLRRLSDDKWWDFLAATWDTVAFGSLGDEHKQAMTDKGDGTYEWDFNQTTIDGGVEREYLAYYRVTSAGNFQNRVWQDHLVFLSTLASQYWAEVECNVDEANDRDRYEVVWHKDAAIVAAADLATPQIRITKTDGDDLVAADDMTQVTGENGWYYSTTSQIIAGQTYLVTVTATIDAATRTFTRAFMRDSA